MSGELRNVSTVNPAELGTQFDILKSAHGSCIISIRYLVNTMIQGATEFSSVVGVRMNGVEGMFIAERSTSGLRFISRQIVLVANAKQESTVRIDT